MPFGLKNATATFQRMMDKIVPNFLQKLCIVFINEIIIFPKSLDERLHKHNLKIQLDKSEVPFLGHIIIRSYQTQRNKNRSH